MEIFAFAVVAITSYLSIVCIIVPRCGVPKEPTGSWFVDHMFALMCAGSIAILAIALAMGFAEEAGIGSAWISLAGILISMGGCVTVYVRWVR